VPQVIGKNQSIQKSEVKIILLKIKIKIKIKILADLLQVVRFLRVYTRIFNNYSPKAR
jgi:hypothetical protein